MRSTLRSTESTLKGENKMKALVCGSFDPITNGHVDLIKRAASMFEDVTVGIFVNSAKRYVFSEEQRLDLIREAIKDVKNAHAELCSGLVARYCTDNGIGVIVKGVRNVKDYEYELDMALTNKLLAPGVETLLLPADPSLSGISSSAVRTLSACKEDVTKLVPECVAKALSEL